jgi:hypothetical protein
MKNLNLLVLTLALSLTSHAMTSTSSESPEFCPQKLFGKSNIQVSQSISDDKQICYLSVHPRDAFETLVYRDYLLSSQGLLLVFNSLKPDEGPQSAGAREFFFFQNSFQGFQWEVESDELIVTGLANLKIHFSLETAQINSIENVLIQLDPKVNPNNAGGLEILKSPWSFLDTGFFFGNTASSQPNRQSTLKNKDQATCRLRNRSLFDYLGNDPKVKSPSEIQKAAETGCPGFLF